MKTMIFKRQLTGLILLATAVVLQVSHAGESKALEKKQGKDIKAWTKEKHQDEIKYEISFLAKKLLDMSGEETITVNQDPIRKPFLGICSEITPGGVQLTCVTPGHNAKAAGLQTGDMVVELNGVNLVSSKMGEIKEAYYHQLMNMKTGQSMLFKVYRGPEALEIPVTVGEINHPGYIMTIKRK